MAVDESMLVSALFAAVALLSLYLWRQSQHRRRAFTQDRAVARDGKDAARTTNSSLPDPDPLVEFDLETTTSRNFVYANKTVRHPYYQVWI